MRKGLLMLGERLQMLVFEDGERVLADDGGKRT